MDLREKNTPNFLVILGPTATGKTKLAVKLAQSIKGEIISADSRQVYKGLDIGTGKDMEEYNIDGINILYHLINILEPMEEYNVFQFQHDFHRIACEIHERGNLPILCGGTGFYMKAVLLDFQIPSVNPDKKLRAELETLSLKELIQKLDSISPGASNISMVDTKRRVIRTIEVAIQATKKNEEGKRKQNMQKTLVLGIDYPREVIRHRITTRLQKRIEQGMIAEVEGLLQQGVTHERLEALGLEYRFISRYLMGEYDKEEMTSLLNTAIHQFAKKQMTFFRNMEKHGIQIYWIPEGKFEIAQELVKKKGF